MEAYVLIQTDGDGERLASVLREISGVVAAEDLRGPYDAIALASPRSAGRPVESVVAEIKTLPSVVRVLAAPLVRSQHDRPGPARNQDAAA